MMGSDEDHEEPPLERDEEHAGHEGPGRNPSLDLLFRTRLHELDLRPPISVAPGDSVAEAIQRMRDRRIGCVLVIDSGRLVGIFTERDVLYKVAGMPLDATATRID